MASNPYNYTSAIQDPERFFGRTAELQRAREIVLKAACLSVVGGPHCGLTSLLYHLKSPAFVQSCEQTAGPLMFIYLSGIEMDDPLEIIRFFLQQAMPSRPLPNSPNWRSLQGRLISTFSNIRQRGRRIVLLLDDFEPLGAKEGAVEFLESLRALSQGIEMTMITATRTELKRCCHQDVVSSPFPNIFQVEYVEPWHPDELETFIATTSERSGVDLVPYVEQISAWSGRIPYLVQLACWHYDEAATGGAQPDDQAVRRAFMGDARQCLQDIWEHLFPRERQALSQIVRGEALAEAPGSLPDKGYIVNGEILSVALAAFVKEMV